MSQGQADPTLIPHDAWLIICDGRKAMFVHNAGTPTHLSLQVRETLRAPYNPSSHEQGGERPGRSFQSTGARRSAMEMTDLHEEEERLFLIDASGKFSKLALQQRAKFLVLAAPPRALAVLREHLDDATRDLVVAEIAKDLTKHPMADIERLLTQA